MARELSRKEIIRKMNIYFSDLRYVSELCKLSNNDPNKVLDNLTKVISYYLITGNVNGSSLASILRGEVRNDDGILCTPCNTMLSKRAAIYGLYSPFVISNNFKKDIHKLGEVIGSDIHIDELEEVTLQYAIYRAIKFLPFYNLFWERPDNISEFIVNEEQFTYYKRVLENKARSREKTLSKDDIKLLEKVVEEFIDGDPCVYLTRYPQVVKNECIVLPNWFMIVNCCAKNKGYQKGDMINPVTIKPYDKNKHSNSREPIKKENGYVTYSRYENIVVDENFTYSHDNLSGDARKDIIFLYGKEDIHDTKDVLRKHYIENLKSIREKNDISLKLIDGKYHILNGRHRIVYARYYYDFNKSYYENDREEQYKRIFTFPVLVTHRIEDKEFNELYSKIEKKGNVVKNNILNDDIDVCVFYKKKLYFASNLDEFRELVSLLEEDKLDNKYFYISYNEIDRINYDAIILRILEKKPSVVKMSFREFIKLVPDSVLSVINVYALYNTYTMVINNHLRNKFFNLDLSLLPNIPRNDRNIIIDSIIQIFIDNPDILKMKLEDIVNLLRNKYNIKDINLDEIKDIISKFGINNDDNEIKKTL